MEEFNDIVAKAKLAEQNGENFDFEGYLYEKLNILKDE